MRDAQLYKYTPGQASSEELDATFVGRHGLLEQQLSRVRGWVGGAAPEHTLLLGSRGLGKTHLLRVIAQRLGRAHDCPGLRVVVFPEESYTIGSLDDLLLQVWAKMPESGGAAAADGVRAGADWVLDRLRELGRSQRTRVLLLVDGFDLLLDQMRIADEARLHHILVVEQHICMIAAAPHAPAAITEHDRPLFHLLRLERLRPLEPAQADEMLRRRAEWVGDDRLVGRWTELGPRIKAISEVAGRNPRLLLMLYQSLRLAQLPTVIQSFRALLDELTPLYKHVVEDRAPQQRKLLGLAAFHDRGASPSELAAESGLQERHVAALLGDLVKAGLLRRVRRPGARTSAYPFTEPLLRMWLQMRASPEGERRIGAIVEFFRIWYAEGETDFREAMAEQMAALAELHVGARADAMDDAAGRATVWRSLGDSEKAIADLDKAIELGADHGAFRERALVESEIGRRADALADLDRALELEPNDVSALRLRFRLPFDSSDEKLETISRLVSLRPNDAWARKARGLVYFMADRQTEALLDFNRALELSPADPLGLQARALAFAAGARYDDGIADIERALELQPDDPDLLVTLCGLLLYRALAFMDMGRNDDALLDLERSVPLPAQDAMSLAACVRIAQFTAAAARQADVGRARRAIDVLVVALGKAPADRVSEAIVASMREILRTGDVRLSTEVLDRLTPLSEQAGLLEPFRQVLAFVAGGRDPYFLEALNPDIRRAVELLASELGSDDGAHRERIAVV